jgi:hypothetical protein
MIAGLALMPPSAAPILTTSAPGRTVAASHSPVCWLLIPLATENSSSPVVAAASPTDALSLLNDRSQSPYD